MVNRKILAKSTIYFVIAFFPRTPGVGDSLETVKFILK